MDRLLHLGADRAREQLAKEFHDVAAGDKRGKRATLGNSQRGIQWKPMPRERLRDVRRPEVRVAPSGRVLGHGGDGGSR